MAGNRSEEVIGHVMKGKLKVEIGSAMIENRGKWNEKWKETTNGTTKNIHNKVTRKEMNEGENTKRKDTTSCI